MRAVRYHEHGGPEVLRVEEVESPVPAADELLVRVEAAAVNPVDTYFREGEYEPGGLPWTPGSDVAGVVEAVGSDVERFQEGDRVVATGLGRTEQGTCAESVAVPADLAGHLPDGIRFDEAAAVALVGVTAWRALVHHAGVEPGERVLVHGASGGVGHVAVQLADAAGARVTATSSPDHRDPLLDLGADDVLDYRRDDLGDAIETAGEPTTILDPRANEYFELDAEVAAHGATVVGIGNTAPTAPVPMGPAKFKELRFQLMSMFNTPDTGVVLERLAALIADAELAPVVARSYGLTEVGEAHRTLREDSFLGKLVVEP